MVSYLETMAQWAAARALRWREERGAMTTTEVVLLTVGIATIVLVVVATIQGYLNGKLAQLH
jgi:Flp pilus assembly pilin Flp